MNSVIIVGQLNNTNEVKMFGEKNLEVLEFLVEGIKCKAFGKLATEIKKMNGLVIVTGEISLRDYTNKEGKTYPIQEIIIKKAKCTEKPVDNFTEQSDVWDSAKDIDIPEEELPFY